MKRLTRKIGLFGGPAALMSPMGAKKSVSAGSVPKTDADAAGRAAGAGSGEERPPARRGWLRRLLLGNDDAN